MHPSPARRALAGVALLCLAEAGAAFQSGEPPTVHWQRKRFAAGEHPPELPADRAELVQRWAALAADLDYRMDLDPDARVLVLSTAKVRSVRRQMELVEKTLERFDELLPWTAPTLEPREGSDVVSPIVVQDPLEPVVLVQLEDREDYLRALDFVVAMEPYLEPWAGGARSAPGFLLERPLAGAWIVDDPEQEEWDPRNEMVNRLARGLLVSRFGHQPHWFAQGVAWNVELDVRKSIHSFPDRGGFVGRGEHGGWESALKAAYGKREGAPLELEDASSWRRGIYDDDAAAVAWGTVRFLVEHRAESLSPLAADLALYRRVHGVITRKDGTWTTVPDYRVPAQVQAALLARHAGVDVFTECAKSFREGHRYRGKSR